MSQSAEAAVKAMERAAQLREAAKAEREEAKKAKQPLSFNQKVRRTATPPLCSIDAHSDKQCFAM